MSDWIAGTELGKGATARVLRGDPGTVVKIFAPDMPAQLARLEAEATECAAAAGLPVARLIEARLDATPPQLVFEFVDGVLLSEGAQALGPQGVGAVLAELQHKLRSVARPGIVSIEDAYSDHLAAGRPAWRDAAAADLARLTANPEEFVLCHMDLHPLNVMWADGPVLIDWSTGMAAPPAADVARTRMLLATAVHYVPGEIAPFLADVLEAFVETTEVLAPGLVEASREWDRVIATERLAERPAPAELAEHERWLESIS